MIFLFTDFGSADLYVGQVKAALAQAAPGVPVIDLLNDAPRFAVSAGAHLLCALAEQLPHGSVTLAVIDPGVGTARRPVVLRCDQRWFVGPDNGLLAVLAARFAPAELWEIVWRPASLARSFHGRDLFAPVAGRIAAGLSDAGELESRPQLQVQLDPGDLWQIVYLDGYGNAMTGIRSQALAESALLLIGTELVAHAGVFAQAAAGQPFWYVNSIGLVEIACNRASAAARFGLSVGDSVGLKVR